MNVNAVDSTQSYKYLAYNNNQIRTEYSTTSNWKFQNIKMTKIKDCDSIKINYWWDRVHICVATGGLGSVNYKFQNSSMLLIVEKDVHIQINIYSAK